MRGWQRRLFVLTDNSLLSFVRLEDERATHVYSLTDYQITEPSTNIEEPDKFTFELTSGVDLYFLFLSLSLSVFFFLNEQCADL